MATKRDPVEDVQQALRHLDTATLEQVDDALVRLSAFRLRLLTDLNAGMYEWAGAAIDALLDRRIELLR